MSFRVLLAASVLVVLVEVKQVYLVESNICSFIQTLFYNFFDKVYQPLTINHSKLINH